METRRQDSDIISHPIPWSAGRKIGRETGGGRETATEREKERQG